MQCSTDFANDLDAWLQHILTTARHQELGDVPLSTLQAWLDAHFELGPVGRLVPTSSSKDLTVPQLCQKAWCFISREVLSPPPGHALATHQAMLAAVYAPWPRDRLGPHPVWSPSHAHLAAHNLTPFLQAFAGDEEFQRSRGQGPASDWEALHALSVRDPERVWSAVLFRVLGLPLHHAPARVLTPAPHPDDCVWLPGARMNIAWCALHAARGTPAGADAQPAILWADEGAPCQLCSCSRLQLRALALQVAACLRTRLKPGDPVAIILPMTPLAVAVYLGCVLAGCPVVSIADSFAAHEIEARLRIAGAQLVITQDVVMRGGKPLPLLPRVLSGSAAPPAVVVGGTCDLLPLLEYPWDGTCQAPCQASNSSGHGNGTGRSSKGRRASMQAGSGNGTSQGVRYDHLTAKHGRSSGGGGGGGGGRVSHRASHPSRSVLECEKQLASQLRSCDMTWTSFMQLADPREAQHAAFLPACAAPDSLHVASPHEATNILFSSGTTGEPKAIVWDHVSPLRCAADGWAHQNIQPGDRVAWPTSLGWMMGPWLVYAALLNGACITLYNGAPLGRDFGQFLSSAGVHVLGLVPSIVRAWRHSRCMEGLDWPCLRCISSTGEASAPEDYHWLYAMTRYRAPIIEYCGGTELSGAFITGTSLQYACPSTFTTPSLGTQLVLLTQPPAARSSMVNNTSSTSSNNNSNSTNSGGSIGSGASCEELELEGRRVVVSPHAVGAAPAVGEVALLAPSLGQSQRLLNKEHAKVYYEGMPRWPPGGRPLRRHGDELCRLPGGYYSALGRVDDTMNLGGIKVASVELERAVMEHVPQVAEAAAVSLPSVGGGPEQLVLFAVLRKHEAGQEQPQQQPHTASGSDSGGGGGGGVKAASGAAGSLLAACQAAIRSELNPLFKVERVVVLPALPRNASNKIMRRTLRDELLAQQQTQHTRSKL